MVDHRLVKLGKKEAKPWPLKTEKYFSYLIPDPPKEHYNSRGVSNWGMMLNDELGCCVVAGGFHAMQSFVLSQIADTVDPSLIGPIMPSGDIVLRYYEQWGGYIAGDPSTDNGMVIVDFLNHWRKEKLAGYELLGFADPNPKNRQHVMQCIAFFGGLQIGLRLPVEWQNAKVWDLISGATLASWGLHCVIIVDYNSDGVWAITWGGLQFITWRGLEWSCDEAHVLVTEDFHPSEGFDTPKLLYDLKAMD